MAALANTHPTLLDFQATLGPDDKVGRTIGILDEVNPMIADVNMIEGNEVDSHVSMMDTGIPEPAFRKYYGYTQPAKGTQAKVRDTCAMAEAYPEVDKALADRNNNAAAFRMNQLRKHIEGFGQKFSTSVFYGNSATEPEGVLGLAPRFATKSGAVNGENIILGGGAGADNASIWLVVHGETKGLHGFYPKGSQAGIQINDQGEQTKPDPAGTGGYMQVYRNHIRWDWGFAVPDWRYIVRIPNIDVSDLKKDPSTGGADLIEKITMALELPPDLNGRPIIYCCRTLRTFLRLQVQNAVKNSTLTMEDVAGKRILMFDGIPVKRVDSLLENESLVA